MSPSLCHETTLEVLENAFSQTHQDVLTKHQSLFISITESVREYMSRYDLSHDFNHVLRVLTLSRRILDCEQTQSGPYDPVVVFLSALVHDVGDHKYLKPGEDAATQMASILAKAGASDQLIAQVQTIANNVSYTSETKDPQRLQGILSLNRELAIVQDADRLDAIGATGIGRTFAFGGAKRPQYGLQSPREHISEKLETLEGLMKTKTGKCMAAERTNRLKIFKVWWDEEMCFEA